MLPWTKANGDIVKGDTAQPTILILTDEMVLYIREQPREGTKAGKVEILFKKKMKRIVRCEVFR